MPRSKRLPDLVNLGDQSHPRTADTAVAGLLATLITVPSPVSVSISLGAILSLVLAPVTFPELWRNVRGRTLIVAILALLPIGWFVGQAALFADEGRAFSIRLLLYEAALAVGLLASVVGAYWCIQKLGLKRFLILSFAGLLVAAPFFNEKIGDNPWKYGLALPVSMLAILLLARDRFLLALVVTPVLAAVSIATDFRTWIALLAIATMLTIFTRDGNSSRSTPRVIPLGLIAIASSLLIGWLVTQAALAGMLGERLEQRTRRQLEGGNLLLGGRPEWSAALAIIQDSPLGIGLGVSPSYQDYLLAIRDMPLARGAQELTTVATSFRQGIVGFHSTLWTFWGIYSLAGAVFSILALAYLGHAMTVAVATFSQPSIRAAVALLMLSSIWDVLFSATLTAQLGIGLATAVHILGEPASISLNERNRE